MLEIIHYPDPILRNVSTAIPEITPEIRELAEEMFETMYENIGVGLAAPQIGQNIRLFVVDVREDEKPSKMVFVNPVITARSKQKVKAEEGCLSLPDIAANVARPECITVKALNLDGEEFVLEATGFLARCIQHEYDHLEGIVFTDKVSLASKLSVKSGLHRLEEEYMDRMSKKDA